MAALTNPKHERFAQELAKGKTASEAYVEAGYSESRSAASRLSTNVNIIDRVAAIQDRGAIRTEITLASLMAEAAEIQAGAVEAKQFSAATAALTAKAKLAGLWIEKSETENVNTNYVVSSDPVDNVEEWEAEHAPKH